MVLDSDLVLRLQLQLQKAACFFFGSGEEGMKEALLRAQRMYSGTYSATISTAVATLQRIM